MADAPKLLACPFCGADVAETPAPWGTLVRCDNDECAARWTEATPAAWNARSPATAARVLLAMLDDDAPREHTQAALIAACRGHEAWEAAIDGDSGRVAWLRAALGSIAEGDTNG